MELKKLSKAEIKATKKALKLAMIKVGGCDGCEWSSWRRPKKKCKQI